MAWLAGVLASSRPAAGAQKQQERHQLRTHSPTRTHRPRRRWCCWPHPQAALMQRPQAAICLLLPAAAAAGGAAPGWQTCERRRAVSAGVLRVPLLVITSVCAACMRVGGCNLCGSLGPRVRRVSVIECFDRGAAARDSCSVDAVACFPAASHALSAAQLGYTACSSHLTSDRPPPAYRNSLACTTNASLGSVAPRH
jgi:hypothetical protein